ncbi:MAG: hypothetical protein LBH70_10400 [Spirochaetaceae bacterium]|jgi:hypothetical protein|nr:hypothetical protein [Spirochaetaceae bacterium]
MRRLSVFFFVVLVLFVHVLGFTQTKAGYTLLAIPVFTETGLTRDVNLLFGTMVDELEWLTRDYPFVRFAKSKGMYGKPPPAREKLNLADHSLEPKYAITGILSIEGDGTKIFEMSLWNLDDSFLMAVQEFTYTDIADGVGFIPFATLSLYSSLPGITDFDIELKSWKNKWFYLGLQGGFSPRVYVISGDDLASGTQKNIPGFSFDAGVRGELQLFPQMEAGKIFSFGLQSGVDFTYDAIDADYSEGDSTGLIRSSGTAVMSVPFLAKFNIKPKQFVLSPYGGVYFILPLSQYTLTLPLGYTIGFNIGYKTGAAGTLFFNFRFSGDIGKTIIPENNVPYSRYLFSFLLGFEWGFFTKKLQSATKALD